MKNLVTSTMVAMVGLGLAGAAGAQEDRSDWPGSFTVGAASQGGTYFVYGSGWANLVAEELGVNGGAEVTGGPVQNAALIQSGELEMGMVTMGPAKDALDGNSELAPGLVHDKLRAIFPMYQTAFHMIAPGGSGIDSMESLPDGSRVGVGPAGGTPGTYWPRFFETLGKDVESRFGGASDLSGQMQDGLIDAFAFAAGLPFPAFSELEAQADVTFVAFTPEQVSQLVEAHPVSEFTIPAGTYNSMEEDQNSVSMWNFAVGSADLPESFVYEVVKAVMENHERMMTIHAAAAETLPENFEKNTFLPWHPGAVRWFEENGHEIPDDLEG